MSKYRKEAEPTTATIYYGLACYICFVDFVRKNFECMTALAIQNITETN